MDIDKAEPWYYRYQDMPGNDKSTSALICVHLSTSAVKKQTQIPSQFPNVPTSKF
ncbi:MULTISPECIES: hypothetical protein [Aerosakkonema]|uniref:hypothetical protein n=1 Tax=Aerosakkonema TaxID=1246629 RepID=UPI0035B777CC